MNAPGGAPTPSHLAPLTSAILRYLAGHPEARDSVEGIHAWWLEDGEARWRRRDVEDAVSFLVDEGWVQTSTIGGAHLFSLRTGRLAEVRALAGGGPAAVDSIEPQGIEPQPAEDGDIGEH